MHVCFFVVSKLITKILLKTQQKIENCYVLEHNFLFLFLVFVFLCGFILSSFILRYSRLIFIYVLCRVCMSNIFNPLILLTLPFQNATTASITPIFNISTATVTRLWCSFVCEQSVNSLAVTVFIRSIRRPKV
jgi:hypothetical protein